ncbi:uncharacterized protein CANTADRAFT_89967 [Suhomyces tanzawaensis NRRL Y-17324]|uniref:Uncharacterized protein n=1 Tax=Suhomyces tanzawaensis NRRL Y-17324 TaxID=984487 RepID=A0A1E4SLM5_9ASCO|nr:uncharacterized protein CANTADRAFT_89967 [Suhomyces tanzawaensis NRRL Y-17324]ODV80419.1 hypothetical protein CANTADRAFT_89967 [Suhomyces tanzawaensis NRRL Y-17324]
MKVVSPPFAANAGDAENPTFDSENALRAVACRCAMPPVHASRTLTTIGCERLLEPSKLPANHQRAQMESTRSVVSLTRCSAVILRCLACFLASAVATSLSHAIARQ